MVKIKASNLLNCTIKGVLFYHILYIIFFYSRILFTHKCIIYTYLLKILYMRKIGKCIYFPKLK